MSFKEARKLILTGFNDQNYYKEVTEIRRPIKKKHFMNIKPPAPFSIQQTSSMSAEVSMRTARGRPFRMPSGRERQVSDFGVK